MSASVAFPSTMGGPTGCQTTGSLGPVFQAQYTNNNQMSWTSMNSNQGQGYNAAGDVINDGARQYLYDGEGRICEVLNTLVGVTTAYLYDADGRRVAKGNATWGSCDPSANGFQATTDYVLGPAGEQVTEMTVNSGVATWAHTNAWAGGTPLATYDIDGLHFYLTDPLGTRRVQTDDGGVVERTCQSLPFGDGETCTPTPTEHLFTGKERDSESGNDYFGARYYASTMGRFLSPDEANLSAITHMDDPQSWNGYAYGRNNPLKYTDPDGNNYHVCDQYGNNCSDQSDIDFAQNMKNAVANGEHWGGGKIELADGSFAGTYVQTYEDSPGLSGPANVASARMISTDGYGAINFMLSNAAIQIGTAGLGVAFEAGADAFRGWRAARVMAGVAQAGREGEAAVRALEDIGPKTAIEINGRTRIPDGLTDTAVNEVKNVSSLAFTRQLRDMADFAAQSGRQFNLWVPGGTELSGPLQAAVAAGKVTLKTF